MRRIGKLACAWAFAWGAAAVCAQSAPAQPAARPPLVRPESKIPRVTNGWQRMVESGALIDRFKQPEPITRQTAMPSVQAPIQAGPSGQERTLYAIPRSGPWPVAAAPVEPPSTAPNSPSKLPRVTNGWRRIVESGQLIDRFKEPAAQAPTFPRTVPPRAGADPVSDGIDFIGPSSQAFHPASLAPAVQPPPVPGAANRDALQRMQGESNGTVRKLEPGASDRYAPSALALPLQLPSFDTVSVPGFTVSQNPQVETVVIRAPWSGPRHR